MVYTILLGISPEDPLGLEVKDFRGGMEEERHAAGTVRRRRGACWWGRATRFLGADDLKGYVY